MKVLRQVLILCFLLSTAHGFAQQNGSLSLTADKLDELSIPFDLEQPYYEHAHPGSFSNNGWKYHPGDDMRWKEPSFNDQDWKIFSTDFNLDSIKKGDWQGIGWFRLKIKIDSSLYNRPLALVLTHFGASEIYFDGQLMNQYGIPSEDPKKEKTFRPLYLQPVILPVSDKPEYTLAVRYSFQDGQRIMSGLKKWFMFTNDQTGYLGFTVHFASSPESITLFGLSLKNHLLYAMITFAALFLIGGFHSSIYIFYSKDHSNLFLAFYNFTLACFLFEEWLPTYTHLGLKAALVNDLILWISWNLWVPVLMLAYYSVFYKKMPWYAWLYFTGILLMIIDWVFPISYFYTLHNWLLYIAWLDMLRLFIRSFLKKEKNVWIVGIGVLLSQTAWILYQNPSTLYNAYNYIFIYIIALAVPISLLIFNALRTARTTINLEKQLAEVMRLSQLSNAQEQEKQKILTTQKELLERQVKERTSELTNTLETLRSAQEQLIHAEKMVSMGELTAGIAHEIQNPLNFVNNFSDLNIELSDEILLAIKDGNTGEALKLAEDMRSNLIKISEHGQDADAIVKAMLQHSRMSKGQMEPVDVNALITEYIQLAFHGFRGKEDGFRATIKTDLDSSLKKINVVPHDIGRVFLNLLNNAFYTVSEKQKTSADFEPTVAVSTKDCGEIIEIRIRDNGMGIPCKIIDKIFQPFFTTKPPGKGVGLGLSLCYDIIKVHHGKINVESKAGEYTEFIIQLPNSH